MMHVHKWHVILLQFITHNEGSVHASVQSASLTTTLIQRLVVQDAKVRDDSNI